MTDSTQRISGTKSKECCECLVGHAKLLDCMCSCHLASTICKECDMCTEDSDCTTNVCNYCESEKRFQSPNICRGCETNETHCNGKKCDGCICQIANTKRKFTEHTCKNNDIDDMKILPIARGGIVNYILKDEGFRDHDWQPFSIWINYCPFCGKELIL